MRLFGWISLGEDDKDTAKHLYIKLPLDLRYIKTLEESKLAIPATSSFWIRLMQPLLTQDAVILIHRG